MIFVPFELAAAWITGGVSVVTILWWCWEEAAQGAVGQDARSFGRRFWRCHICTAVYTGGLEERLTICPRCGTYNSEGIRAP